LLEKVNRGRSFRFVICINVARLKNSKKSRKTNFCTLF
jgi:hypothetical protein